MIQEIFVVHAQIVDANGTFNELNGYPKAFKSTNYDNDIVKAKNRATAEWHDAMGAFGKRDDRQVQSAFIVRISDGAFIASGMYGALPLIPDPEPPEPEPENEGEGE